MKVLTKVIFKSDVRRDRNTSNKVLAFLAFLIVFGFLALVMTIASVYITDRLVEIEQPYAFISLMLLFNFAILFVKSIFEVLNVLFFSKDLKILLRMPIKSKDIIHAKLLKMIVSEYEMELIMLAIPMVIYGIKMGVDKVFYLYIPVILAIIPVIPICIVSVIISVIMRFTNMIKNKSRVLYITLFVAIILVDLVFRFSGDGAYSIAEFQNSVLFENGLAMEIADKFKLIWPIMEGMLNYNSLVGVKSIMKYIGYSVIAYIVTLIVISPIYLKGAIGTVINSNRKTITDTKLKLEDFNELPINYAYRKKEYKIISRSPIFFIQCVILPVVMALSIFAIAIGMTIFSNYYDVDIVSDVREKASLGWGTGIFISICQVFYMMNFSSIIAVSKEERWARLTKYMPIKLYSQMKLKIHLGKLVNFITALPVIYWYYICSGSIVNSILLLIVSVMLNSFGEKVKILIDMRNPKIDWDNEYTMMKQNTNVMYELFYTIIVLVVIIGLGFLVSNLSFYFSVLISLLLLINLWMNDYLRIKDYKIFEKLY